MINEEKIKEQLYDHCLEYVNSRLKNIQAAMQSAKDSANDDSKSSAGDKHETGRAMAQLEQEKLSSQLSEIEKLSHSLSTIIRGKSSSIPSPGSAIITDKGNYFISISAGKAEISNETYFIISPASPIGSAFIQNKGKSAFIFNNQNYNIKKVF